MHRLEKLAPWRIDPVSIEFPEDGHRFEGGYATVSRGRLGSSTRGAIGQVGQEWRYDGERKWEVGGDPALCASSMNR